MSIKKLSLTEQRIHYLIICRLAESGFLSFYSDLAKLDGKVEEIITEFEPSPNYAKITDKIRELREECELISNKLKQILIKVDLKERLKLAKMQNVDFETAILNIFFQGYHHQLSHFFEDMLDLGFLQCLEQNLSPDSVEKRRKLMLLAYFSNEQLYKKYELDIEEFLVMGENSLVKAKEGLKSFKEQIYKSYSKNCIEDIGKELIKSPAKFEDLTRTNKHYIPHIKFLYNDETLRDLTIYTNELISNILFDELFKNSSYHKREGITPKMIVTVSKNNDYLTLNFEDNGKGISEENLSHVFEYGFTTREGGTGIGLPLAKDVAKYLLEGDMSIKSVVGKGTNIEYRIPQKNIIANQVDEHLRLSGKVKRLSENPI